MVLTKPKLTWQAFFILNLNFDRVNVFYVHQDFFLVMFILISLLHKFFTLKSDTWVAFDHESSL